jgi:hypothetical protein
VKAKAISTTLGLCLRDKGLVTTYRPIALRFDDSVKSSEDISIILLIAFALIVGMIREQRVH